MGRSVGAHQHGTNGRAVARGGLEHVEQNVGCVQVGADQDVGFAVQRAVKHGALADLLVQGCVAMHFAIALDTGVGSSKEVARFAHLQRRLAGRRAVVAVRQESHLGWQTKARHFVCSQLGDLGQFFRAGVFVDVGVGNEQGAVFQHHGVHRRHAVYTGLYAKHFFDVCQVAVKAAYQACQHGVCIAQVHHQRSDDGVGAAHGGLGTFGGDAVAPHQAVVSLPVLAEAWVVFGVAHLVVHTGLQAQTCLGNACFDHGRAANQDGLGQSFFHSHLHGAQHALVFTFGIGHALQAGLGRCKHGAHDHAGLVDKARQALAVGRNVCNGASGHARLGSSLCHSGGNAQDQAGVKRCGDQVVGAELQLLALVGGGDFVRYVLLGQCGDFAHAGQLHAFRDLGRAAVQCATEDVGEAQHVVHLVRIVRTAGGDDAVRAHGLGQLGADFWLWVGQRQDDGLVRHGLDHLCGQHAGGRAAQEDVSAVDGVCQRTQVGVLRVLGLRGVKATGAAVVDHALGVAHEHVLALHAQAHHDVHAGNGCCAGAGDGHLHVFNLLAYQFQTVEQGGARDDGRTVLVVVEDGDVHALGEFLLNVEALGRLDVFEVDAAQRGLQRGDDLDQLVRIALVQLDVEHVHACKLLEETPLAFHHRLASQRADVTQTQHSRAVGDHAHQIATRGVLGGLAGVCLNVQAGVGHAG